MLFGERVRLTYGAAAASTFDAQFQERRFGFLGTSGDVVTIHYLGLVQAQRLQLVNAAGTVVATSGSAPNDNLDITDVVLSASDEYRITVTSNDTVGDFGVSVQESSHSDAIVPNISTDSTIGVMAEVDQWSFDTTAGSTVTVDVTVAPGANPQQPSDLAVRLELVRPSGTLASSATLCCDQLCTDLRLDRVPVDETGTWTVRVRARSDWGGSFRCNPSVLTGSYTLAVCPSDTPPIPIAYGQNVAGQFTDDCQIANFEFSGQAGDVATIMYVGGPSVQRMRLLRANGELLATASLYSAAASIVDQALPANETYQIVVDAASNSPGPFVMALAQLEAADAIVPNIPTDSTIGVMAEVDQWSFDTTAGSTVTVDVTVAPGANPQQPSDLAVRLELVRPSGTLASSATLCCDQLCTDLRLDRVPVDETGTWTVRVRARSDWGGSFRCNPSVLTGSYTLAVCYPDPCP